MDINIVIYVTKFNKSKITGYFKNYLKRTSGQKLF